MKRYYNTPTTYWEDAIESFFFGLALSMLIQWYYGVL